MRLQQIFNIYNKVVEITCVWNTCFCTIHEPRLLKSCSTAEPGSILSATNRHLNTRTDPFHLATEHQLNLALWFFQTIFAQLLLFPQSSVQLLLLCCSGYLMIFFFKSITKFFIYHFWLNFFQFDLYFLGSLSSLLWIHWHSNIITKGTSVCCRCLYPQWYRFYSLFLMGVYISKLPNILAKRSIQSCIKGVE